MSDGMTDSRRGESAAERLLDASEKLADALLDVRDNAFGYSSLVLEIVNEALERARVKVTVL